jgi:exosortase/archaeosortase family protein
MLARYSRILRIQKIHFFVGLAISLVFTSLIAFNGFNFWIWQASMIDRLLSFAGVSHKLFISSGLTKGPTIEMPINFSPIPFTTLIALLIVLASVTVIVNIFRGIPSPVKAVSFVVSILAILTLLWQTMISPIPSYNLHWVTLDWSCSGVITLALITLIYVPFLFTIKGPLRVKVFWLFITIGFSIVWNLLRMSLVTATLYYFGGLVFLLSHYLLGAFIDFIYIVAFYSLALAHLSKYELSEGMKFDA